MRFSRREPLGEKSWKTFWLEPPVREAPKSIRLRFVRDLGLRGLGLEVVAWAIVLAEDHSTWLLVAATAVAVTSFFNIAVLDVRLRTIRSSGRRA